MRIALRSDFLDYYDHWFDRLEVAQMIFYRLSRTEESRREIFHRLEMLGLRTPPHGTVTQLVTWREEYMYQLFSETVIARQALENLEDLVVYTDEYAHAGEGKIRLSIPEALENYPNAYASLYIPQNPTGTGISFRYLQVGKRRFWIRYTSSNDWRSNSGDVQIDFLTEESPGYHPKISEPLFAIDFLPYGQGSERLLAIDFNTAPVLRGTGIDHKLSSREVYDLIHDAMVRSCPKNS